jgi:DNA polymerase III epsilon subunit-like protein
VINTNTIFVFDFESLGLDPINTDPVQIAGLAIDPRSLDIIPGSEFNSLMRPIKTMTGTPTEVKTKWINAAKALDINKKKREDLEKAPLPQHVWKNFCNHVGRYNTGGKKNDKWTRPIAAGHNIQGFDLLFVDTLCKAYGPLDNEGKPKLFNPRTILDTLNLCFLWFENTSEPASLGMDILREYFGVSKDGSHDALNDCKITAQLLIRFLKVHRYYANKVKFKGSFLNDQ